MKALEILYSMIDNTRECPLSNKNNYEQLTYIAESIEELETIENRSCDNCKNSSFETKFGELEFNACFLVSTGNVCKWESK